MSAVRLLHAALLRYMEFMQQVLTPGSKVPLKTLGLPSVVATVRQPGHDVMAVVNALGELENLLPPLPPSVPKGKKKPDVAATTPQPHSVRLSPTAQALLRDAALRMWKSPIVVFPETNPVASSMVIPDLVKGFRELAVAGHRVKPQPGLHILVLDTQHTPWVCFLAGLRGDTFALVVQDGMPVATTAPWFQQATLYASMLAGCTPLQLPKVMTETKFFEVVGA